MDRVLDARRKAHRDGDSVFDFDDRAVRLTPEPVRFAVHPPEAIVRQSGQTPTICLVSCGIRGGTAAASSSA